MNVPVLTVSDVPELHGAKLICSPKFDDKRGFFKETYNLTMYQEKNLRMDWTQDNLVFNKANVLRGLHIQKKRPQGKLVTCITGKIIDVGLDLRHYSSTFKKHAVVELSDPCTSVYWPPGIAHGYYSPWNSTVIYKCTTMYDRESDGGVLWCDPDLGINWGDISPVVSQKDMCLPKLSDYLNSLG